MQIRTSYCFNKSALAGPKGQMQVVIPNHTYFAAEVIPEESDEYILVSCAVAPGFDFSDFRLVGSEELTKLCPSQSELIDKFT